MTPEFLETFEAIGLITVSARPNEAPDSPGMLAIVRPHACYIGGERVGVASTKNTGAGMQAATSHQYLVFHTKPPPPPAPVKSAKGHKH
jgi:hypothetical protein